MWTGMNNTVAHLIMLSGVLYSIGKVCERSTYHVVLCVGGAHSDECGYSTWTAYLWRTT